MTRPATRPATLNRSTLTRLLALAAVALLLAGCIKFDTRLTVSTDNTVSGEVIFAFDRALLEMSGGTLDDLLGSGLEPIPDDLEGITVEDWEDGNFTGQRFVFDAVPLDDLNADATEGSLRIERDGDMFRLSATMDMTGFGELGDLGGLGDLEDLGTEDLGFDPSLFLGNVELAIAVTFPGEILETNGTVEGTTVTWEPSLTGTNELMAVARAEPAGGVMPWLLVGAALLLVLAVVAYFLLRRRGEPEPATVTGTAGAAPGSMQPPSPGAPADTPTSPPSTEPEPTGWEPPTLPPPPPPPSSG